MMTQQLHTETVYKADCPQVLVVQISADHERSIIEPELKYLLSMTRVPFVLCRVEVNDWNADLSPWRAPSVFGKTDFAGRAGETLLRIETDVLPSLRLQYGGLPVCLAGYSLAGLFALWASMQTRLFGRVAAASPSVWYQDWITYAAGHPMQAQTVYLSLGDMEDRTRQPLLREVKKCISQQDELLEKQGIKHILEWNQGTHFNNPDMRLAKAIAWCLDNAVISSK